MPDHSSRFSLDGEPILHYMGCSTFSNFTVLPEIAVAKVREDAPFEKICYIGCGVTTGIGAVAFTMNVEAGSTVAVFGLGGIGLNVIQGAGLELPLACHLRIAADTGAKIGLPEMDLGSVPAWGGSARLPRAVGRQNALDMILRARKIDGHEALAMGLVTEIVPIEELKSRAQVLGEEIAKQPRLAVQAVLATIVGFETKTLEQSIGDELAAVHKTLGTPDANEGMLAFMEKRKPVFNQS